MAPMKFIHTMLAVMVGMLMAATAWGGAAVEELHGEAVVRNAELQAQVDAHEASLADLGARHDAAQADVATLQEQLQMAEAALQAAHAELLSRQEAAQGENLDAIDAAVKAMLVGVAAPVVELINDYGYDGAAQMIAARLGLDPLAVSALLAPAPVDATPLAPAEPVEEAPEEGAQEVPEPSGQEEPAHVPAEEVPAESGDTDAGDSE